MKLIKFFILFLLTSSLFAQNDSLDLQVFDSDFDFNDGIFLSFDQVKTNSPISKNRIISILSVSDYNFFEETLDEDKVAFYDQSGARAEVKTSKIWGYSDEGTLHINWNDDFYRIAITGSICHFVANKVINSYTYNPYSSSHYYDPYSSPTSSSVELRQYILDFKTGIVYDYSPKNLEIVLMNDPELYDEYNNLKRRKKKKLMFVYVRKYNSRNKTYIPK